jgi:hypothetical protein
MYGVRECGLSLFGSGQGYYSDGNRPSDSVKTEFFFTFWSTIDSQVNYLSLQYSMEQSLSVSDMQRAYRPSRLSAVYLSRAVFAKKETYIEMKVSRLKKIMYN